jgi:type IX secretion system PorP/SprF family membrane protein
MGESETHINFTGVLRQHTMMRQETTDDTNSGIPDNSTTNPGKNFHSFRGEQILLDINSYIKQIKGAVGITFLKDKNAEFDNVGFKFGYATRFKVRGGKLGIGLQLGFVNTTPSTEIWKPNQIDDNTISELKSSESVLDFDMNFGIHYRTPTWHVGVSCSRLPGVVRLSGTKDVFNDIPQQLYITGGYIWNLETAVPWSIEPSALIRTNMSTWSLDLMAVARYNGILWFGLAYQYDWAIAALFGAVPFYNSSNNYLKGLELGLAYSFPTNKLGYRSGGSMGDFELVVRYGFNFYRDKQLTGYGSSRHLHKNQY